MPVDGSDLLGQRQCRAVRSGLPTGSPTAKHVKGGVLLIVQVVKNGTGKAWGLGMGLGWVSIAKGMQTCTGLFG